MPRLPSNNKSLGFLHNLPKDKTLDIHFWYETEFDTHHHSYYEILISTKGKVVHYFNDEPSIIKQKTLIILKPSDTHKLRTLDNSPFEHLNISINESLFVELCSLLNPQLLNQSKVFSAFPYTNLSDKDFKYILHLTDNLYKTNNDEYQSSLIIKQIVSNIIANFPLTLTKEADFPPWLQEFLQKLSSPDVFIQPISELYKYAPYSQAKLAKHFKEHVGTTIVNYLAKQKILYACHLLNNTNFSILKIASMLNYDSLPHFNRTFKKIIGKTPREYRSKLE